MLSPRIAEIPKAYWQAQRRFVVLIDRSALPSLRSVFGFVKLQRRPSRSQSVVNEFEL